MDSRAGIADLDCEAEGGKLIGSQRAVELLIFGAVTGLTAAVAVIASHGISDLGDYLGFIGAAFGAGVTVLAAERIQTHRARAAALIADRQNLRDVRGAIEEALRVHQLAIDVCAIDTWKNEEAARIGAKADQLRLTIDRLLARPGMSLDAIAAGSSAIRLMEGVAAAAAIFFESNGINFGPRASFALRPMDVLAAAANDRLANIINQQTRLNFSEHSASS